MWPGATELADSHRGQRQQTEAEGFGRAYAGTDGFLQSGRIGNLKNAIVSYREETLSLVSFSCLVEIYKTGLDQWLRLETEACRLGPFSKPGAERLFRRWNRYATAVTALLIRTISFLLGNGGNLFSRIRQQTKAKRASHLEIQMQRANLGRRVSQEVTGIVECIIPVWPYSREHEDDDVVAWIRINPKEKTAVQVTFCVNMAKFVPRYLPRISVG